MVLNGGGDDVIPLMFVSIGNALQREIIRLSSSTGKNNLLATGANKFRSLRSSLLYCSFCLLPIRIHARRIAECIGKKRQHGLYHIGMCWCGGSVVQIYPAHLTVYSPNPL